MGEGTITVPSLIAIFILLSNHCYGMWTESSPKMTLAMERPWTPPAKFSSRDRAGIFRNSLMAIPQMPACSIFRDFEQPFAPSGHFNRQTFPWVIPPNTKFPLAESAAEAEHAHLSLMFNCLILCPPPCFLNCFIQTSRSLQRETDKYVLK